MKTPNCPRCGQPTMEERPVRNALSRRVEGVYVCPTCGTGESLESYLGVFSPWKLNPEEAKEEQSKWISEVK